MCRVSHITTFTYGVPNCDALYYFLVQQHWIRCLSLYHPLVHPRFNPRSLPSWFLGHLVQVEAPVDNICDLIVGAPVHRIKFRYSDFEISHGSYLPLNFIALSSETLTHLECLASQLVNATEADFCLYLPALRLLHQFVSLITDLAKQLTSLGSLKELILRTSFGDSEATIVSRALRDHCHAPLLRNLWFHSAVSCYHWDNFLESVPVGISRAMSGSFYS
ncbi:hypothetical protein C8F04DRAFT_1187567 [Mycena alexandri]|uniref:Uncharacterized protein n=1 Tax=Mycena alexandri TaxID=1745969 RepID=A0AAD6WY38_9AGAR|nr:hypothetical protein C8F04DRAFT_1187567 [Mycena alexandri]